MINIPSGIFGIYNEAVDSFIDDLGVNCKIYYHKSRENCSNCVNNKNYYGGLSSFSNANCSYCGGDGYRETQSTDTIKLRIYPNKNSWIKIGDIVNAPDGTVQVIGYLSDVPKMRSADYIVTNIDQSQILFQKYSLHGEINTHGFNHDRYFVTYLKRMG